MPATFVGETRFPRDFRRYSRQFSLLEIDCEPGSVPGKARLQACAEQAPEGFVFSLVVPSSLASLEAGEAAERAWKAAQNVARILKAKWWVVRTPTDVRPTRRAREQLGSLFARLGAGGMRVAWEPRGLWEDDAAGEAAAALGAYLVHDVAKQAPPPADALYARVLALARGARVGLGLAERIAQRMHAFPEAFVAVEGSGARAIQAALGMVQDAEPSESELDASELDDSEDSDELEDLDDSEDSDEDDADEDDADADEDDSDQTEEA
jgi:uncharacterized protein YecE (DUF72 family)